VLKRIEAERAVSCVVVMHAELAIGSLRGILKQAGITAQEFIQNLNMDVECAPYMAPSSLSVTEYHES